MSTAIPVVVERPQAGTLRGWRGSVPGCGARKSTGYWLWLAGLALGLAEPPARGFEGSQWQVFRAGDGLTESQTTAVTVGPRGNVWVKHGEVDAVSWLDGYTVRHIPAPGERNQRIYESRAGRLWSVNERGVLEFVGEAWRHHPIAEIAAEQQPEPYRFLRRVPLLPAESDRVLILLRDRLMEFRSVLGDQATLRFATNTGLGMFEDFTVTIGEGVWVCGSLGVARIPGPLRQIEPSTPWIEHLIPPALGVKNLRRPLGDDDGGVTTIGEKEGVEGRVLVHFDGREWFVREVPGENLRFAWRDAAPGRFWATTANALLRLDGESVEAVRDGPARGQFFDVAVQPRGVFWLATMEGLVRRSPTVWRTPASAAAFDSVIYSGLTDEAGRLWFANAIGLIEGRGDRWVRHQWPDGFDPNFRARDALFLLPENRLAVSAGEQLLVFDPLVARFTNVFHPEGRRIRKVLRRRAEGVLVLQTAARDQGGAGYEFELFDGREFRPWPEAPPALDLGAELFFLAEAAGGELWLGGSGGVAVWRGTEWQKFSGADGYQDEGALSWVEVGEGRVWCAGLNRISEYDGRRWSVVRIGFDRVSDLLKASDGSIWVATGSGLYRYYRDSWAWVGEEDGLPGRATYTVLEDRARQIWVGTSRGISQYFPRADTDAPRTLEIDVEQRDIGTPAAEIGIKFLAQDRWRSTPGERLLYSYRLGEGIWSPFSSAANVVFRDLSTGRHRIEVRAMDRNWNIELRPAARAFRLELPWFRDERVRLAVVVGLLATLAAAALAVNRHLQLRQSYARVERMVAERTRELQRATEALAQSQKMTALGTLAAGIAHDFNNILSVIRGSAQIIETNLDDRHKVLTRVARIKTVVDQAAGVVRAMLGFGRVSENRTDALDLREVVEETERLLGDRFRNELRILVEVAPALPAVRVVRDRLQQMLLNLILNAAEAMGGTGRVGIRIHPAPEAPAGLILAAAPSTSLVQLSVSDEGTGIAPEHLPRLFEPFFTTKALSARRGTGLGLFMVYEFAQDMGCGIAVETKPGRGSTFSLLLPVASDPGKEAPLERQVDESKR
ncbi:MAG: ATP-binding protein [Limisphaerales bacterium]